MERSLATLIGEIKSGRGPRCLLLFGDDLQVQVARESLVDGIMPVEQRPFNLERFDGRTVPWEDVRGALMTPPLCPGKKLVWIENAPYFISRDQKGELGERMLQLWGDGKQEEASKLLIDLLVLEGWPQERWERFEPGSFRELSKLLGLDASDGREGEDVQALLRFSKAQGVDLNRYQKPQPQGFSDLLEHGLPEWGFLLLTATQVDRRMRLYKRCEELGYVVNLSLDRDRTGNLSRDDLLAFINQRAWQAGKTVGPLARDRILQGAGADLRRLSQELEKLFLFAGESTEIRAQDVETIFTDHENEWVFDITRTIGDRNPRAALGHLERLISRGEPPLKLLGVIASEARRLLAARQLLDGELRDRWKKGISYSQFQQRVGFPGKPLLTRTAYGDYMCFQRAERLSLKELRSYMRGIHEADFRLKSSGNNPRLVMERLVLGMCLRGEPRPGENTLL